MPVSTTVATALTFGDLLKQLRKRVGMSQGDLAAAVGYSVPFISNLELNQRLPDVEAIAQRFVPALALQEEPQWAARLVELAAEARGERPPPAASVNGETHRHLWGERGATPTSLPLSPTELLGRAQEIKTLCNRLLGHSGRLLTLIGPPGVGKTSLGLAVAEKLQAFYRDGVYFVPLAAIADAELVAPALVSALGIGAADERAPKARLIDFLRRKEVLLLLDNFEQITAAGVLVAELLAASPGLRVLVTSRERLHLRAEQRYRVPPMEVDAAVELFVQRAQAVAADFALTPDNQPTLTKICQHLDGLPLAIELCAARVDLFTPQALLMRLRDQRLDLLSDGPRDLPPHQRTLRNAIQRSYALLDEGEQCLFRRLGVFAGGFEAVAALGDGELTLQSLINKSLVQLAARNDDAQRFILLETLREFAWEQLNAQGEAVTTQRSHAEFYLRLAEEAATNLRGPTQSTWLQRLEVEHANLRAALAWSLAARQTEIAMRLGIALWRFWYIRGYYGEGGQWLKQLLIQAEDTTHRAKLFYAQGMLARRQGDMTLAADSLAASLALGRELGDQRGIASALRGLGFIRYLQHDNAGTRPLLDEALALFHDLGDLEGVAVTLDNLAYIGSVLEESRRLFEQSLALRRQSGNLRGITMSLAGLASNAIHQEDYATARYYLQEHLQINEELGNQNGIAISLSLLAEVAVSEGDYKAARLLYEKSMQLSQATGDLLHLPSTLKRMGLTMLVCGETDGVGALLEEALLLYQEQGTLLGVAEVLSFLANLAVRQGLAERALTLASAAMTTYDSLTVQLYPLPRAEFERTQAAARQMLSAEAAAVAWAAGRAMAPEQAVDYALAKPPA